MIRDEIKDINYFKEFITYQNSRIQKFEQKLIEENDIVKKSKLNVYLAEFKKDLFFAEYSIGSDIDTLKEIFIDYLSNANSIENISYNELVFLLSGKIIFNINENVTNTINFKDDFIYLLKAYLSTGTIANSFNFGLMFPEATEKYMQLILSEISIDNFKEYLRNEWYIQNINASWYDSHKKNNETYVGYYDFTAAAVMKMLKLNKLSLNNITVFPYDII